MKKGEPIPTNIFNSEKKDYIVKSRTIGAARALKSFSDICTDTGLGS